MGSTWDQRVFKKVVDVEPTHPRALYHHTRPNSTMAPIKVGVLLVNDVIQFLDVAVVDLLSITTKEYLQPLSIIPESIRDKGTDIQFLYINEKGAGTVFDLTGGLKVHITVSMSRKLSHLTANSHTHFSTAWRTQASWTTSSFRGPTLTIVQPLRKGRSSSSSSLGSPCSWVSAQELSFSLMWASLTGSRPQARGGSCRCIRRNGRR